MRRFLHLLVLLTLLTSCSTPFDTPPAPANGDPSDVPSDIAPAPTGEGQSQSTDGSVTISFAAWDFERPVYEGLAKSFTAQNPGINVVIVPLEDLTNVQQTGAESPLTQLRRVVAGADTAPAVFTTPNAYDTNLVYNLQPLMEADPNFQRDDFYAGTLERYTTDKGVWVLPHFFYVQLLDYNKDLFTQNSLPEPKPGWTWDDLLATAQQLAKKNGSAVSTYGYFDWSNGFTPMIALLEAQDVPLVGVDPAQVQLDRSEIVAALQRVRELGESGALLQPGNGSNEPQTDPAQIIRDGQVGIWQSSILPSGGPDEQSAPPSFAVGKVPYPVSKTTLDLFAGGGEGYIISGGTAHPNEAWKWIDFLSRRATDQPGAGGPEANPSRVPARKSLADQTGFWGSMDEATTAAYQAAIATPVAPSRAVFDPTTTGVVFEALQQAFFQVMSDRSANPQKVLAQAQEGLQARLAQIQLTPQPTPDTSIVAVATPEAQTAPEGATAITFSAMGYSATDLRRMARAFREQQPDIFVQIASTDTFTGPVGIQDLARTNDCFAWAAPPQSQEDEAALLNLQPLLDGDATFPLSDFPAAVLAPYQREGGLYGLPYAFNVRSVNYNRTLFDKTSVQPLSAAWTPDAFLQAAKALTSGDGNAKQYGYVPLGDPQQDLFFFVGQFGGRLTSGSGASARPAFDDPKLAEAIQWYLDLANVHKVAPPLRFTYKNNEGGEDQSYNLIQSGRAGMWLDYGNGAFASGATAAMITSSGAGQPVANGTSQLAFEVGVAPLPVGGAGLRTSDLNVRGFHIAAQTQHAQACWEWIKYMSQDAAGLAGELPARTSLAATEAFTQQAPPGLITLYQAYGDTLKRAAAPGESLSTLYQMDTYWLFKAISEANAGKADLRAGLAEAQKLTTAFLECNATEKKPATCARRVDPTYQGYNTEDAPQG